jgi:hypothetical protein
MALEVIDQSAGFDPVILSSGGAGAVLRLELPGAFSLGPNPNDSAFFSEAFATPAQGLALPNPDATPADPECVVSNGISYCRTPVTYCTNGIESTIYVLASVT